VITACVHAVDILLSAHYPQLAAVFIGIGAAGPMAFFSIVDPSTALEGPKAELTNEEYEDAVSLGAAMTYDEVVAFALAQLDELLSVPGDG